MRTHRTTALLALIVVQLTFGTLAVAGELDTLKNTTPEERAKAQTAFMASKLDLKPDQKTKVAEINLKYAKKMDPVLKGDAGPFMKMREMRKIGEEKEAELKQILSPEQFDKYLASKEEMREKFEERMEEKAGRGE